MKTGEALRLTDGKGKIADAIITDDHKKKTVVLIEELSITPKPSQRNIIAISLLKNNARLEWFLEKAAELGISKIVPLLCERTEKQHFRYDRMRSILVSAMLQSQQPWLTELSQPVSFKTFIAQGIFRHGFSRDEISREGISREGISGEGISRDEISGEGISRDEISGEGVSRDEISRDGISEGLECFIAHCEKTPKEPLSSPKYQNIKPKLVLIGPEGDFTPEEIKLATDNGFIPVELGKTRLRTETAGVVAATLLQVIS